MSTKIMKALEVISKELEKIPISFIIVIMVLTIVSVAFYFFFIPYSHRQEVQKDKYQRYCLRFVLILYIGSILLITIFSRSKLYYYRVNLIPFNSILNFHHINAEIVQDINNSLLFFPMGVLYVWQSRTYQLRKVLFISIGISLGIEGIQFVGKLGKFDIDDIIFNVLGGVSGGVWFYIGKNAFCKNQWKYIILRIFVIAVSVTMIGLGIFFAIYHFSRISGGNEWK